MPNDKLRASTLRAQADEIDRKVSARENKQSSDENCGCEIASAVARGATTVALGALLGLPISF